MELQDIFMSTMAGAAIVLLGALYSLFYALGKLNRHRLALLASGISYLGLVVAVIVLIDALHLQGFWLFVTAVMLIGYLLAPMAIWRLCTATHGEADLEPVGVGGQAHKELARTVS